MKHKSRTQEAGHLTVVSARVEVQWTEIRRPQLRPGGGERQKHSGSGESDPRNPPWPTGSWLPRGKSSRILSGKCQGVSHP